MKYDKTQRGFQVIEFKDRYDVPCSIQKSSLATEDAIWIGVDDADPKMFIPGPGWLPLPLPELPPGGDILFNTRMHVTRDQVKEMLPILKHFVATGELPIQPKEKEKEKEK